jgi:hypothetical protein
MERKLKMQDPYPVRKELLDEYNTLLLQFTFYSLTDNKIKESEYNSKKIYVFNKIVKERNDEVFDLLGHSSWAFNFCMKAFAKASMTYDKCLLLYCFEHKGFDNFGFTFSLELWS